MFQAKNIVRTMVHSLWTKRDQCINRTLRHDKSSSTQFHLRLYDSRQIHVRIECNAQRYLPLILAGE